MTKVEVRKIDSKNQYFDKYWSLVRDEFDNKIPWLKSVDLLTISSFVFLDNGIVMGGVSIFSSSPETEVINQQKNTKIGLGGVYVSCFVLRKESKGRLFGKDLFKLVLKKLGDDNNLYAWGVVSDHRLIKYYKDNYSVEFFNLEDPSLTLVKFICNS